jgi:hypothetical protein
MLNVMVFGYWTSWWKHPLSFQVLLQLKSILTEEQGYPAQSVVIVHSRHHFEYEAGHVKVHLSWITAASVSFSRNWWKVSMTPLVITVFHLFDSWIGYDWWLSSFTLSCQGAVNLRDPGAIEEFYSRNIHVGKQIAIVFHCEFSSSRAPKL